MNQYRKFQSNLNERTQSWLHLSSKCHHGVLEERLIPVILKKIPTLFLMYLKPLLKVSFNSDMKKHSWLLLSSKYNFGGLDDGVILSWSMACWVSIKGLLSSHFSSKCLKTAILPLEPTKVEIAILRHLECFFWKKVKKVDPF